MKNRILLTIVALVILPTALLSLMAGRAVRNRELVIIQQMQVNAASMTRLTADEIEAGIKDELNRIRQTIGAILMRTASAAELARTAEILEQSSPIIDHVIVYHDPWDIVYPQNKLTTTGEPSTPTFVEQLRVEIAQLEKSQSLFSMNDAGAYYCFTLIPGRQDLYAGFKVDLVGFRQMLDRALGKLATDDIVLVAEGRMYQPNDSVIIEDSLSPAPVRESTENDFLKSSVRLFARAQLARPFTDVSVSAYARNPDELKQAGRNQGRLLLWGIVLLAGGILAGVLMLSFQIREEIRRTSARANYIIGISHDLRTPIASLKMLTESLYSGTVKDPDKRHSFLGTMAGECDRLNRLVERVLYFVRYGEDALVFFKKTTEIEALLNSTVKLFFDSSAGQRTEVDFCVSAQPDLPEIETDDNAIQQVLLNLLDNALKYGHGDDSRTNLRITVSATVVTRRHRPLSPSRKWIRISVADNGPGINPAERRKIFRPYYRASYALNANVSGVGLGLALCKHIARAHDGWMAAENDPDGGAVFSIYLPYPS